MIKGFSFVRTCLYFFEHHRPKSHNIKYFHIYITLFINIINFGISIDFPYSKIITNGSGDTTKRENQKQHYRNN